MRAVESVGVVEKRVDDADDSDELDQDEERQSAESSASRAPTSPHRMNARRRSCWPLPTMASPMGCLVVDRVHMSAKRGRQDENKGRKKGRLTD
jgi:hypothetical protein